MPDKYVIITAGGIGTRMGSTAPKQFLELEELPVILHSIKAFIEYLPTIKVIIVLPENSQMEWNALSKKYGFTSKHRLCTGGDTRFQSVKNGLKLINGNGHVAIHDAARPLVSVNLIARCFDATGIKGNAIPAISLNDSIREVVGEENSPVFRDKYRLIQTPQVFDTKLIQKAYDQPYRTSFTDDASVAESIGVKINLIEGEPSNMKLTTQEDMVMLAALIKQKGVGY